MIDDKDIKKLKTVFLTKDDAKNFLTKKDGDGFLNRKVDGKRIDQRFDRLEDRVTVVENKLDRVIEVMATKQDLKDLEDKFDVRFTGLESKMDTLIQSIDGIVKRIDISDHETVAVKSQLDRHDGWIKNIAKKTEVELKY